MAEPLYDDVATRNHPCERIDPVPNDCLDTLKGKVEVTDCSDQPDNATAAAVGL